MSTNYSLLNRNQKAVQERLGDAKSSFRQAMDDLRSAMRDQILCEAVATFVATNSVDAANQAICDVALYADLNLSGSAFSGEKLDQAIYREVAISLVKSNRQNLGVWTSWLKRQARELSA